MISQRRRIYDSFVKHGPCVCAVVAEHTGYSSEQVRRGAANLISMGCMVNLAPGKKHSTFRIVEGAKPPDRCYQPATARKRVIVAAPKVVDICLLAECLKNWRQ